MRYEQRITQASLPKSKFVEKYQLLNYKYYENILTTIDLLIPPIELLAN